tara:strand:- start:39 stop:524 length:486 start_codon:yes stop_codon:yes gene_type:complete
MSAASNYLELEILDHILRYGNGSLSAGTGAGYQPPATVYVALFSNSGGGAATALESGTNSTSGTGNWGYYEINNGSYARQSVTFAAASSGSCASNATVTFPVATANYNTAGSQGATVTHLAIMDASTSGNLLFYGALTTSKTVSSGDQFTISSGNLTVSLA